MTGDDLKNMISCCIRTVDWILRWFDTRACHDILIAPCWQASVQNNYRWRLLHFNSKEVAHTHTGLEYKVDVSALMGAIGLKRWHVS